MKRFVRLPEFLQATLIALGGFVLVAIVEQETVVSYLVLAGVTVLLIRAEWLQRRRRKGSEGREPRELPASARSTRSR